MVKNLFQFGPYAFSLIIITYTFLMVITNYDLIIGRWALNMDEQILFDGPGRTRPFCQGAGKMGKIKQRTEIKRTKFSQILTPENS